MRALEPTLVDRLYEAAVIPELWSGACDLIAAEIGAFSTAVISIDPDGVLRFVASDCIADGMRRYQASGLAAANPRPLIGLELAPGSFLRDIDLMSAEAIAADRLSTEVLHPLGLAWELGSITREPSGSFLICSILGRIEDGPFSVADRERMNVLQPDLARATLMATRLAFEQARTVARTLSAIGLPAAVIGDGRTVLAMNEEMEELGGRIRTGFGDRLVVADADAGALLQEALDRLSAGAAPTVQSIPVAARIDAPALVLHLVPIRRNAQDIFSRGRAILIATPVGETGPPDMRVICGLFDLTRVEARLSQLIATGQSIEEAAATLGVARETVRTHLKAVFRKTGVRRQAELVALLSGLGTVRG